MHVAIYMFWQAETFAPLFTKMDAAHSAEKTRHGIQAKSGSSKERNRFLYPVSSNPNMYSNYNFLFLFLITIN